jgi:hypothetical protein
MKFRFFQPFRWPLVESILIGLTILCFDAYIFSHHLQKLYPLSDEFSLIVESRVPSWNWFLDGYSKYFIVYPEFFEPYSNFIRPISNSIYWLFSPWTEYRFKLQLVIVNYGAHAAISTILFEYSYRILKNSVKYSISLGFIAFLAPAFWCSPMPFYPSFSLDGLAALLCFVAILMLTKKSQWLGLLFLILAIFTKETALPILAAVIMYSLLIRNISLFIYSSLILVLWGGLRATTFGSLNGTYALSNESISSMILRGSGLLRLPISNTFPGHLRDFFATGVINGPIVFLVINLIILVLFGLLIWKYYSNSISASKKGIYFYQPSHERQKQFIIFVISVIFSAIFFSFIAGTVRFSYVFFIFFLGTLAACPPHKKLHLYLFSILFISTTISDLQSVRNSMKSYSNNLDFRFNSSRKLIKKLQEIGSIAGNLIIVNDFIGGYSRRDNIAKFSGGTTKLIGGTSIELVNCHLNELKKISTLVEKSYGNEKVLTVKIPKCAKFVFEGAANELIDSHLTGSLLSRNDFISYEFPLMALQSSNVDGAEATQYLGEVLLIKIKNSSAVFFDFNIDEWVYLP